VAAVEPRAGRIVGVVPVRDHLLRELSDGRFHSGQRLAQALGISRSAVWKHVQRLESEFGLSISAVRGRGYRLSQPMELLDAGRIRSELSQVAASSLQAMSLLSTTASTNSCASRDLPPEIGCARVWLAEHQTEGRGRRGRSWVSTFGENLYISIAWRFDLPMSELAGLSLVAGVVVCEVLAHLGLKGHSLKWPNDILVGQRKLSGILVEASGEADGPATAVLGIGVNFRLPEAQGVQIDQPWTDLSRVSPLSISRNRMAGILIDRLILACHLFAAERLAPFLDRWETFDGFSGQPVNLIRGKQTIEGIYRGIAPSGAMVLEDATGRSEHHAGEVSLRKKGEI
jgi:BirA family biotin operon repressor/biotin-[acetyl-CoA-carboxylase] ligase